MKLQRLCCQDTPLMYNGELAYVCHHTIPRVLLWPDGMFVLTQGQKVAFDSLTPDGEIRTDAFGWLRNYR